MAEMFLSATISILTNQASKMANEKLITAPTVAMDCKKLRDNLLKLQVKLKDAEERSKEDSLVKEWMHSLKDAVREAEDVLNELQYDAISKAIKAEIKSEREKHFFRPRIPLIIKRTKSIFYGQELERVMKRINDVLAEETKFNFATIQQPVLNTVIRPMSHSLEKSEVIGRSNDFEKIVAIVLDRAERERVAVLPIVGPAGIGKTTLTRLVYNSEKMQKHFEMRLWVCVTSNFHATGLAKLVSDLAIGEDSMLELDNILLISLRFKEELGGKKYLLVLDDVPEVISPGKWTELKSLLDYGSSESVIIVMTQSRGVATIVGTTSAYELHGLNEDHLWGIFRQRAFALDVDKQLVEIGRSLIQKCCGSPMVATILGGLMSYKKDERDWKDVLHGIAVENVMESVLKLCYEDLPSHIKQCFAFCAVYPKGYEMERETLIQLWIANNCVPVEENMEMEAKGVEIFNELAWRGFFQNIKECGVDNIVCKMHDLIHEHAQFVAGNECAILLNSDQPNDILPEKILHVSLSSTKCIHTLPKECASVRTILALESDNFYEDLPPEDNFYTDTLYLSKAKSCRALSLRRARIGRIDFKQRTLNQLRYLDLSYCFWLKMLPNSFSTLYSLQTLKLSYCRKLNWLPKGMRYMRSLRHVYLNGCDELKWMPEGLGKLRHLKTLTKYMVRPAIGYSIEELQDLNLGGQLEICGLENVGNQQEARLSNLVSKENLIKLELRWKDKYAHSLDGYATIEILQGLEPCQGLEQLQISNYDGIKFSAWMHDSRVLQNLVVLVLQRCRRCTELPPLWELPSLETLRLIRLYELTHIVQKDNQAFDMFPVLKHLFLSKMRSLGRWQANDQSKKTSLALPQLCELFIRNCPKLDALPSCPLLSKLEIIENNNIESSVIKNFKENGVQVRFPSDVLTNQTHSPVSTSMEGTGDFALPESYTKLDIEEYREKLCQILPWAKTVIAEVQDPGRDETAKKWLCNLKATAHEVEDVLIELDYDATRNIIKTEIQSEERPGTSRSDPVLSLIKNETVSTFQYCEKMKRVLKKIEDMIGEMNPFGFPINNIQQHVSIISQPRSPFYGVESEVNGRSSDLQKIVTIVLAQAERKSVAVLPIWGTSGLGKTTLCQLVYNNAEIQNHFELVVWKCVSGKFDVSLIANSITDLALGKESQLPVESMELIKHRIREVLLGKKYLLVLDDVSNENESDWEKLKHLLDCGSAGSVIIVTTCSQRVAEVVGTLSSYALQGLNEDDLWSIFRQKAFGMGVDEENELVHIGKQLIRKCCGSPLFAKIVGGLMSSKKEKSEWLEVLESNIWDHVLRGNGIIPLLKLSFMNLPSYMKTCFKFCSIFPKDYTIERDTLIQLWMANRFIPVESNKQMEDMGIEIFDELAWRGFFEDIKPNKFTCKMHNLVHDFAQYLVDNEVVTLSNLQQQSKFQENTIHLFACCNTTDGIGFLLHNSRSMHTILLSGSAYWSQAKCVLDFSEANSFRALSFHYIAIEKNHAIPGILKHLMYLDISWCPISELPESFSTLFCLQTLKVNNCWLLKHLPLGMRHMRSLRHLYLDGCYQLERMPEHLGELGCLQVLTMYLVNPAIGCGVGELKDLDLGGRLELYDLSKLRNIADAQQANLVSKTKLTQLNFSWGSVESAQMESDDADVVESNPDTDNEILQSLKPNGSLEVLEIRQYNGTQFSAWMHDFTVLSNLSELVLVECTKCKALPPLSQIPSLKKLVLVRLSSLEYIVSEGSLSAPGGNEVLLMFPKLEHLSLVDMPSLVSWLENDPAKEELKSSILSKLGMESFQLSDMPRIEVWPEVDLKKLTSLEFPELHELIIMRCPKLDALPSCRSLKILEIAGKTNIPYSVIKHYESKGTFVK